MLKTLLRTMGAATVLIGSQAMAAQITLNAGDSAIFNFAPPSVSAAVSVVSGYALEQPVTGTMALYGGANLSGSLIHTDIDLLHSNGSDYRTDLALLDGFSILINITSGTFAIDPLAVYMDAGMTKWLATAPGTVGSDSRGGSTTPSVPEPGSLLLVAMAGLALSATRRRLAR